MSRLLVPTFWEEMMRLWDGRAMKANTARALKRALLSVNRKLGETCEEGMWGVGGVVEQGG